MELAKIHYYDASALVKLFVKEIGSDVVYEYNRRKDHTLPFYTTSLCFAEALGVLKRKRQDKKGQGITKDTYLTAADDLVSRIRETDIEIANVDITDEKVFEEVEEIVRRYELDISDAFQIVTIKRDYFSRELKMSQNHLLITVDKELAKAARSEGLQVWDCMNEPVP